VGGGGVLSIEAAKRPHSHHVTGYESNPTSRGDLVIVIVVVIKW
jgi:hypothetical protein